MGEKNGNESKQQSTTSGGGTSTQIVGSGNTVNIQQPPDRHKRTPSGGLQLIKGAILGAALLIVVAAVIGRLPELGTNASSHASSNEATSASQPAVSSSSWPSLDDREDVAFKDATSSNTVEGYKHFLAHYPDGPDAEIIQKKLATCHTVFEVESRQLDVKASGVDRSCVKAKEAARRRLEDSGCGGSAAISGSRVFRNVRYQETYDFNFSDSCPIDVTATCIWDERVATSKTECP